MTSAVDEYIIALNERRNEGEVLDFEKTVAEIATRPDFSAFEAGYVLHHVFQPMSVQEGVHRIEVARGWRPPERCSYCGAPWPEGAPTCNKGHTERKSASLGNVRPIIHNPGWSWVPTGRTGEHTVTLPSGTLYTRHEHNGLAAITAALNGESRVIFPHGLKSEARDAVDSHEDALLRVGGANAQFRAIIESVDNPMRYSAVVAWSDGDGAFVATVPELPGVSGIGPTASEAVREAHVAAKLAVEVLRQDGRSLPEPLKVLVAGILRGTRLPFAVIPAVPDPTQALTIRYTNWRGEAGLRRIFPLAVEHTTTAWHPEPQWILHAFDFDKQAVRSFALVGFGIGI